MRYRKPITFSTLSPPPPPPPPSPAGRTWQDLPYELVVQIAAEVITPTITNEVLSSVPKVDVDLGFSVVDRRCRAAFLEAFIKRFVILELRFSRATDDQELKEYFDIFNIDWQNLKKLCHPTRRTALSMITLSFINRRTWKPSYRTTYALGEFSTIVLMWQAVAGFHGLYGNLTIEGHISNRRLVHDVTDAVQCMEKLVKGLKSVRSVKFPIDISREFAQNLVSLLRDPGELESFIEYQLHCIHLLHSKGYAIHTLIPFIIQGIHNTAKFYTGMLVLIPLSTGATRSQQIWMELISLLFLGMSEYLFGRENTHEGQKHFMLKDNTSASTMLIGFISIATTFSRSFLLEPPLRGLSARVLVFIRRFAQLSLALARAATLPGFSTSEIVRGTRQWPDLTMFTAKSHLYYARDACAVLTTSLRMSQYLNEDIIDWKGTVYWECVSQEVFHHIDTAIREQGDNIQKSILTAPMMQFNRVPIKVWQPPTFI